MKTLREEIETKHVRYRLNKASVLRLRGEQKRPVMDDSGAPIMHVDPPIFLTRVGDGKMGPFTKQFDTTVPEVREFVDFVDQWISTHPHEAKAAGLSKLNDERPPARIQNWDSMTAEEIRTVLEATKMDLTWAMEYELHRPAVVLNLVGQEIEGGVREDVLEVIEEIYASGFEQDIEQSAEAPAL